MRHIHFHSGARLLISRASHASTPAGCLDGELSIGGDKNGPTFLFCHTLERHPSGASSPPLLRPAELAGKGIGRLLLRGPNGFSCQFWAAAAATAALAPCVRAFTRKGAPRAPSGRPNPRHWPDLKVGAQIYGPERNLRLKQSEVESGSSSSEWRLIECPARAFSMATAPSSVRDLAQRANKTHSRRRSLPL